MRLRLLSRNGCNLAATGQRVATSVLSAVDSELRTIIHEPCRMPALVSSIHIAGPPSSGSAPPAGRGSSRRTAQTFLLAAVAELKSLSLHIGWRDVILVLERGGVVGHRQMGKIG